MIMIKTKLLMGSIIILAAIGCNDELTPTANLPDNSEEKKVVMRYLEKNAPQEQKFVLNSDQPMKFTTKGKLVFQFDKGAFKDQLGKVVTGNVNVSLTEYLSNADIIYGGVTTLTTNDILQSGGMFNIRVTQNGNELELNTKQYDVEFPTNTVDWSMRLFEGQEALNENGDRDVTWEENYDSWIQDDSISRDTVYRTKLGFLNWGNLDKYVLNTNGATIHIKLPETYTNKNTLVYAVMADRSITYLYSSKAKKEFNSKQYLLPANLDFKILVISSADGKLKHKLINSTVVQNHLEIVTELDAISETDLDQLIENI
jgi:hypothetical protein